MKDKLEEVSKGDDVLMKAKEELYKYIDGNKYIRVFTEEELIERAYQGEIEDAKEEAKSAGVAEGLSRGISQGSLSKAFEIASKMLEKRFKVELISECTGLKKKQIESLM